MKIVPAVLVFTLLFTGCDSFGAGPCVHTYEDPVMRLSAATTAGDPVDLVILTNFELDGRPVEPAELMAVAESAELVGEAIHCEVECGFGTAEGTYTFVVHAEGFESASVTLEAAYADFSGGCPSSNSGSTVVSVDVVPEG